MARYHLPDHVPRTKRLSQKPGQGIITYRMAAYNQNDELVAEETLIFLAANEKAHM